MRSAQAYNHSRKAGRAPAKGTIIRTKSTTIAFYLFSSFPSPRCFFFLLSCFFVTVILELLGLIIKKPDFWRLFTHLLEISFGWISKNRLDIQCILLIITPNKTSMFSMNAVYGDMNNDISTLRTESPSIFLDKSGRGRNRTRKHWGRECLPKSSTKLSMLQIQINLRRQSNRYRSIQCVCQQM